MLHSELVPAADANSRALMVVLHGLGDSLEGWRWFPEEMKLPWLNYLLVNAPMDYFGGFSWFNLGEKEEMLPGIESSRKQLFSLLDDIRGRGVPADQITLGGFSQGCLMSIDVGLRYPHRLAGIVGISGWVSEPEKLVQELSPVGLQQRVLMTHGTQDTMVVIDRVRRQLPILRAANIRLAWHEFPKGHTVAGEAELSVIRDFVRAGYPGI